MVELVSVDGSTVQVERFDLSTAGVYLHSSYLVSPGKQVSLRIRLHDYPRPLDIQGKVIRAEDGETGLAKGMGIIFNEIGKSDEAIIRRFLLRRFLGNGC
jgi:hypothetical protein